MNSMLCSTEALLGLTQSHVEKLEQVDRIFFRRLFEVPRCTAIESFYIETSSIPVRFLLVSRRLLFYWTILQKDDDELVKKVFNAQKTFPVRNDWVCQIQSDLETCGIDQTEEELSKMKKGSFKKLVDEKIQLVSATYLINLKDKHSKSEQLKYSTEIQPYLKNDELSIEDKKLMFRLKNRLIDVKINYRKKYKDNLQCRLCNSSEESQPHLVVCPELMIDDKLREAFENYCYDDIFSNDEKKQTHLIRSWKILLNNWRIKLKKQSSQNEQ